MVLPDIEKRIIQLEKRNKVLEEMVTDLTKQVLEDEDYLTSTGNFLIVTSQMVTALAEFLGDDFQRYLATHNYNTES